MCTHFKIIRDLMEWCKFAASGLKASVLLFCLISVSLSTKGQNYPIQITVAVTPPYSTKISDYTSQPGKIMATIRNTSLTGSPARIYLTGSITGESGISVTTRPGYKPLQPLNIAPGATIMLNVNNIKDVFSEDHLVYEGISENDIITGNGLPEDYYTICLRAWDYSTNQPLSDESPMGCCPPFNVTDIEPPVITQPLCGDNVKAITPQSMIISWTHPAGAPVSTRYKITVVEVLPSDHNPNDAMNSAFRPAFFEQQVTGTAFVFGPAQPALVEGKTYAIRITAQDPTGKVRFRNGGRSEVCSFSWKKEGIVPGGDNLGRTKPNTLNTGSLGVELPPVKLPTVVKGRLVYEYFEPDDHQKYSFANAKVKLVIGQALSKGASSLSSGNFYGLRFYPDVNATTDPEFGKVLDVTTTDENGNFTFNFLDNIEYKQLLPGKSEFGFGVTRVAVIVIEGALKSFYFNPEVYLTPEIGKLNDVGTVTSFVRSFQLDLAVKPRQSLNDYENLAVDQPDLSGVDVYLCRKIVPYKGYPADDGKLKGKKDKIDEATRTRFKHLNLEVLAKGTSLNGKVSFERVVWHHNSVFTYYLMADCRPDGDINFILGAPVPFDPPASIPLGAGTIDPSTLPNARNLFTYNVQKFNLFLMPQYPKVAGKVLDRHGSSPIQGTKVVLHQVYTRNPKESVRAMLPYQRDEEWPMIKCIENPDCSQVTTGYSVFTDAAGNFTFPDLPMLFSNDRKQVISPNRSARFYKAGYSFTETYIGLLSFGKQKIMPNTMMDKGAVLEGRIVDAENGNLGLKAYVRLEGGTSVESDANNYGYYRLPVLLLPGKQQKLIIDKEGFVSDTILFTADKAVNKLDVKLYQAKRRLKVIVREKGATSIPVKAYVQILDVTKNNIPLSYQTYDDGIAEFSFINNGDHEQSYRVKVWVKHHFGKNYQAQFYNVVIPVGKKTTLLYSYLPPATCLKGKVTAGKEESPVFMAAIRSAAYKDTLTTYSGNDGSYTLYNFPVSKRSQLVSALKTQSQFIGDEQYVTVATPSNECKTVNFNLTVYNDMDITHLMGFPMEVANLTENDQGVVTIKGNITDLPSNDQFKANAGAVLPFKNLIIKKGSLKNSNGVPIAEPVTLPANTGTFSLPDILVSGNFKGKLYSPDGIKIDRQQPGSSYGVIKSSVIIPGTEFNCNNVILPAFYLATSGNTGVGKLNMPVFAADKSVKKPVPIPATGFWVCDNKGQPLTYSFPNFKDAAKADLAKSFLLNDKLILNTTLHTNCNNVSPADLNVKLGDVEISKDLMKIKPGGVLKFDMDKWKFESTDWAIGTNGILVNNARIKGQMDFGVKNLEIKYNTVTVDKTDADFGSMKILGTIPVNVTAKNKGLTYVYAGNGKYVWKLYASNIDGSKAAAIPGLPGLEGKDLPIETIQMLSDGTPPQLSPTQDKLKIYNIIDFVPIKGTNILVYDLADYFTVQGNYQPHLPYIEEFAGNLAWKKLKTNQLDFFVNNPSKINFVHNNMTFIWDVNSIDVQPDLFTAKGTATEEGKLGPVDIVLMHRNAASEIDIPQNSKIYITQDKTKYFNQLDGGMEVNKATHKWEKFWFEGVMVGMNGISNNPEPSRLKFICEGDIKATDESINVNKLDAFPGLNLTYDIATSSLHGSLNINKDLAGMKAEGTANCVFDTHGWYLNVSGNLDIPGIGGTGLFGLFGAYNAVPPAITGTMGSMRCIPSEFQGSVSGFLLQGRLTKQLIPSLSWGTTLPIIDQFVGLQLQADLSLYARTWMSFNEATNNYGIAMLAEGNISGGVYTGLYNMSTSVNAQLGVLGEYKSNGIYSIIGCGSVHASMNAEVMTPTGYEGVSVSSPDIGVKMHVSNAGTNLQLILGKCGENLCPQPAL